MPVDSRVGVRQVDVRVQLGRAAAPRLRVAVGRRRPPQARLADALLDQRVPRAAFSAAAHPLRRLRAALLTDEDDLWHFMEATG